MIKTFFLELESAVNRSNLALQKEFYSCAMKTFNIFN